MRRCPFVSTCLAGALIAGSVAAQVSETTNRATILGIVTAVDPVEREFTVDTGKQRVIVETQSLSHDPFHDAGDQRIERGDRVSVTGSFAFNLLEGRVFEADTVVTLSDASRESAS